MTNGATSDSNQKFLVQQEIPMAFCSQKGLRERQKLSTVLTRHYGPFVYKPSPYHLLVRYIYLQFMPPSATATLTNYRNVRTHRNTLYMKSSPTGQQYTDQAIGYVVPSSYLAGGGAKTASYFLTAHTPRLVKGTHFT